MKTRIALLVGVLLFATHATTWACGGSCYQTPTYHPGIQHRAVYNYYGKQIQHVAPRVGPAVRTFRTQPAPVPAPNVLPAPRVTPAPTTVPQQNVPVTPAQVAPATPTTQSPTPPAASVPAATVAAEKTVAEADADQSNPFSKLDTQTLLKISGVKQILEGRN